MQIDPLGKTLQCTSKKSKERMVGAEGWRVVFHLLPVEKQGRAGWRQPSFWGLYKPEIDKVSVSQPKLKGIVKPKENKQTNKQKRSAGTEITEWVGKQEKQGLTRWVVRGPPRAGVKQRKATLRTWMAKVRISRDSRQMRSLYMDITRRLSLFRAQ